MFTRPNRISFLSTLAFISAATILFTIGTPSSDQLTASELANLRGTSQDHGVCQVTCEQFQAINGSNIQWSCSGQDDGQTCYKCSEEGNNTYVDESTGEEEGACPGTGYTDGIPQSCGMQSHPGDCVNEVCEVDEYFDDQQCDDPREAVPQSEVVLP